MFYDKLGPSQPSAHRRSWGEASARTKKRTFTDWQEFPTQSQAVEYYSRTRSSRFPSCTIFSFEWDENSPGTRKFLVSSSRQDFYYDYMEKALHRQPLHFYELILENTPCHMYFDLEFDIDCNPTLDGAAMLARFKVYIVDRLARDLAVAKKAIRVVDLVSRNPKKFSHHLIVKVDGCKFPSNLHVGWFVKHVLDEWAVEGNTDFCVYNKNGELVPFLDTGVYTRNRNFRLVLSSKIGKTSALELSGVGVADMTYELFLDTLVCDGIAPRQLLSQGHGQTAPLSRAAVIVNPAPRAGQTVTSGPSPFPRFEAAILEHISTQLCPFPEPFVKSYIYYPQSQTILYVIGGSRFCSRIGRQHQSNAVYYLVDTERGVCTQRCFDPDCRGFRGPPICLDAENDYFASIGDEELLGIDVSITSHEEPDYFQGITDSELLDLDC
ncbi:hypothetical protein HDU91_005265 [Kappamyces sp. JEL0680]|nr:hypothetical protein HDU91_005265 [Kappamyces sp. JEL0680]